MKDKTLYDEYEGYSDDAAKLNREIVSVLKPIYKKWELKGFSIREIGHIASEASHEAMLEQIMDKAFDKFRNRVDADAVGGEIGKWEQDIIV